VGRHRGPRDARVIVHRGRDDTSVQAGEQRDVLVRLPADPAADNDELRRKQRLDVLEVLVHVLRPLLPAHLVDVLGVLGGPPLRVLATDLQVTEFGVGDQDAVDEQGAADPGAERHHQDRAGLAASRAERHLRDARRVGVVQQPDLLPGRLGQQGPGVQADPPFVQVGRRPGHPVHHHPREGDADGPGPGEGVHELADDPGHGVRSGRLRRRDLYPVGQELARFQINGRRLRPRAADIDAQRVHARSFALPGGPEPEAWPPLPSITHSQVSSLSVHALSGRA
jgi:hypothetical protein